ncbi:MAG TPA: indole-3-glycerol phosphate synthase TrpC [Candidatus Saccharimonadales bacterium]|nr:indole-3-glycerol phosphate synthase TrpC [Candidatus Saccharimonadales bacterium]
MHNILQDIIEKKKLDLIEKKRNYNKFKQNITSKNIAVIAEIKLASPSAGMLGSEDEIITRAVSYEKAGANAISFITEKHYFKSDISFIPKIKEKISLPILQKDFVVDAYQIYEAKTVDSDALLLIARLLDKKTLQKFVLLCQELGIEPVVEINDAKDLSKAIETNTKIIAVNARNLENFEIDIENACELLKKIPDTFIKLGFSGIQSNKEVKKYQEAGASAILVGTELMKAEDIEAFITKLKNI